LGFAWLGWAKWHGLPNNLPSCTGANAYVSGGVIY
jgi:1,6-anhydro-N-acetylmuramate kinase